MRATLCALLLAVAMLAGCFGDDGGDPSDPDDGDPDDPDDEIDPGTDGDPPPEDNETPEDENETPEPRDPVTWTIIIEGNQFVDGTITVQQGDTVLWQHQDGAVQHTVTSDDGGSSFHSGDCPGTMCMNELTNDEFPWTFDDVGEFGYLCEVHPSMTGTITVLEVYLQEP